MVANVKSLTALRDTAESFVLHGFGRDMDLGKSQRFLAAEAHTEQIRMVARLRRVSDNVSRQRASGGHFGTGSVHLYQISTSGQYRQSSSASVSLVD